MIIIKKRHVPEKRAPDELVADATIPQAAPPTPPTKLPEAPAYVQTGAKCTRCGYICPKPCNDDWDMCARGQSWNIARRAQKEATREAV